MNEVIADEWADSDAHACAEASLHTKELNISQSIKRTSEQNNLGQRWRTFLTGSCPKNAKYNILDFGRVNQFLK